MKKVKITFPQIVIESKVIEVTNEQHEDLLNNCEDEKVDFIWNNMTDQEQQWTNGKNFVAGAVDCGYCGISGIRSVEKSMCNF